MAYQIGKYVQYKATADFSALFGMGNTVEPVSKVRSTLCQGKRRNGDVLLLPALQIPHEKDG